MSDLKDLFPREYEVYLRIIQHPPEGFRVRDELLGEEGFAIWLKRIFEEQRRIEEERGDL